MKKDFYHTINSLEQRIKELEERRGIGQNTVIKRFSKVQIVLSVLITIFVTGTIVNATVPNMFSNGMPIDANEMNTNFSYILSQTIPRGAIVPYNAEECPAGWNEADGTNGLVDLRGVVIRGWDHDRGFDSGRGVGTYQEDAMKSHTALVYGFWHTGSQMKRESMIVHSTISWHPPAWNSGGYGLQVISKYNNYPGHNTDDFKFYANYQGAGETRPKNVALMYCVKQ